MKPRKNKVIISNEFTFTSILLSIEVNVWLQEKLFFSNYYFLKIKKARSSFYSLAFAIVILFLPPRLEA